MNMRVHRLRVNFQNELINYRSERLQLATLLGAVHPPVWVFDSAHFCTSPGYEAHSSPPAPLLAPPLLAPAPRQPKHPSRLARWARPPSRAAVGANAPAGGRGRRRRRLGAPGRADPEVPPEEEPGAAALPSSGSDGGGGGAAAAEAQRRAAALHRPDLPHAEEHDADGQDGEHEGAGADQPQIPGGGREVKLRATVSANLPWLNLSELPANTLKLHFRNFKSDQNESKLKSNNLKIRRLVTKHDENV